MASLLFTHELALAHVTPRGHPEQVARLEAILEALRHEDFAPLIRRAAPLAGEAEVLRCHTAAHLARVKAARPEAGFCPVGRRHLHGPGIL